MSELHGLLEREKELRCLYRIQDAVVDRSQVPSELFLRVLQILPDGWQHPERTGARIEYLGRSYVGPGYSHEGSRIRASLRLGRTDVGSIEVVVLGGPVGDEAFLPEERQLLAVIARQLGDYLEWKHTQLLGARLPEPDEHWRWRGAYAEALVARLDRERFAVSRVYLGGSTEKGDAGPGSDIDLFVVFHGSESQRRELRAWIEGWSLCLAEVVHRKTGYPAADGLIDLHFLDEPLDPRRIAEHRELPDRAGRA